MNSNKEEWRKISDEILREMPHVPAEDRLRFLQEKIADLPGDAQGMVSHFVSIALWAAASYSSETIAVSKQKHISAITLMALIALILLVSGGLYLVTLRGDDAASKINIFGATVETGSVGVACFALAALLFLFVARKALSRL
ncbi:hypothetical protein A6U86_21285 [Rhizobium sp. AC27/96]|uniref:hypothetical protein n=1 Tax=Rhizobium sp. AC27/96 TaxID=1841653 RepID=UPI000827CDB5|nr:hypothetical protein [Rhizobium sp. AC27/96]OCI91190.1 hypothetical protein A6U86_21285 [Rhizobium sp. AC27/96]